MPVDHNTSFAETKALPTATVSDVAQFLLEQIIVRHGAPRELLADRGRSFLSKVVEEILSVYSIPHKLTMAYHPQTNGLTEGFNRTLADMPVMYAPADHTNWDALHSFGNTRLDFLPFSCFTDMTQHSS